MTLVLIADDSALYRGVYERLLVEEGYEIITVEDGCACLITAKGRQPDLIIMDVSCLS